MGASDANPYAAPEKQSDVTGGELTIAKCVATMIGCGVAGAILGGALGYLMATFVPGYYDAMFSAELPAREIGLGLGVTQGLGTGLGVGAVSVLAVAWYRSRKA